MPGVIGRFALILCVSLLLAGCVALTLRAIDARRAPPIVIVDMAAERPVIVVIDGAVATPGVQTLPAGARLNDAVIAAGGFTVSADAAPLNLARLLVDGERVTVGEIAPVATQPAAATPETERDPSSDGVVITARNPQPTALPTGVQSTGVPTEFGTGDLVDINTATATELDGLPGIGPVLAGRIIAYREENGPYASVDDLEAVEGISANTVENLRPLITSGAGST